MNRRNFNQTIGLGALLTGFGSTALATGTHDLQSHTDARSLYSRERLEGLIGTEFACDNTQGSFRLMALEAGHDDRQFTLRFAALGAADELPETIYLLNGGRSARLALHMVPTTTSSGTELIATINHASA